MSDDRMAEICWANHKKRNDSVVVDLFQVCVCVCVCVCVKHSVLV